LGMTSNVISRREHTQVATPTTLLIKTYIYGRHKRRMNMTEQEKVFLEDTRDILVGYDGNHSVEGLKSLVDETRQRLNAFLNNKIKEYEESL
jgi:hypothetical protein